MTSDQSPFSSIVTVTDLTLTRDGVCLLDKINATIAAGRITMLLGHNGAGKTLLLNCLHGLIPHDSGNVQAPALERQKMVFQKPIILRRSAREHLRFLCPSLTELEIRDWISRAGLTDRIDAPARALSGGEQQKLALVGALAAKPDILFLDEPTAHLDFAATKFVESMIIEAHASGTSIVMTSHNRSQLERLGQDILLLDDGQLIEAAAARTFFTSPQHDLAKQFLAHL